MESPVRLVVGLGNPAEPYARTRHNIGRDFIDHLCESSKSSFRKVRQADVFGLPALFGAALPSPLIAAKLTTYMNESGRQVRALAEAEGVKPSEILVLVDDFMIPFGALRLRPKGSAGGHNGLKSIIETLGTEEFGRLRVGIGPVPGNQDPADFVLERFTRQEEARLPDAFNAIMKAIQFLALEGYPNAMNVTNKRHFEA